MTEPKIIVVHSRKGGVDKTTIAYELAWLLGAVLVDLDWEEGGATSTWGYRWQERAKSPLLSALERGTAPRPLTGFNKPDLVPSHPDFEMCQPDAGDMADVLAKWAGEWGREWVVVGQRHDRPQGLCPRDHGPRGPHPQGDRRHVDGGHRRGRSG